MDRGARAIFEQLLTPLVPPIDLLDALDDVSLDEQIRAGTEDALSLTGRDVGTPILQFQPPDGIALFGPVISRLPGEEEAGAL